MTMRELDHPTQNEVGALPDTSKSLASQRVAVLVEKGMLGQRRDPANHRQVRLGLTEADADTLEAVHAEMAGNAAEIFDSLGPDRAGLARTLNRLVRILPAKVREKGARPNGLPFRKSAPD